MIPGPIGSVVCVALYAYLIVLVIKAVLSWFPIDYDSPLQGVRRALDAVTEPVLTPLRKVIPALQIGGFGLEDFSASTPASAPSFDASRSLRSLSTTMPAVRSATS